MRVMGETVKQVQHDGFEPVQLTGPQNLLFTISLVLELLSQSEVLLTWANTSQHPDRAINLAQLQTTDDLQTLEGD